VDPGEVGWSSKDRIDLAQDRDYWWALVNTVLKLRAPRKFGKFKSGCTSSDFSRSVQLHELLTIRFKAISQCEIYSVFIVRYFFAFSLLSLF
jgi:hypothetical protein